jgi:UDP-N-acetylmuramoylalanine--D-glutamate ligase
MIGMHAVIGLGQTGYASTRFLLEQGMDVTVFDTRREPPLLARLRQDYPDIETHLGDDWPMTTLLAARQIVLSPGVSLTTPAIAQCLARGIPVVGDIELFARYCTRPIIAVTGSNGKSTVVTLLGDMIRAAGHEVIMAGNIGQPVLACLSGDQAQPDFYVLECSSFQLETTYSLRARCACLLNVSPDHMDRYAGFADYLAAKQRIYQGAQARVFNHEDANTLPPAADVPTVSFGKQATRANQFSIVQQEGQSCLAWNHEPWLATTQLKIIGEHNWLNALAALAMGQAIGLDKTAMLTALREFAGLAHRCQWVAEIEQIRWYNDSKGTNVGATCAAISGLPSTQSRRSIVLILGGQGKGADFAPLVDVVRQRVKRVILLGEAAPQLLTLLRHELPVSWVRSMEEAVLFARASAVAGDMVLLSPACASLDMFRDYLARGEMFTDLVLQLAKREHEERSR